MCRQNSIFCILVYLLNFYHNILLILVKENKSIVRVNTKILLYIFIFLWHTLQWCDLVFTTVY